MIVYAMYEMMMMDKGAHDVALRRRPCPKDRSVGLDLNKLHKTI